MKPRHERTRITTPDDYWNGEHPGQADFPDEPVPPVPKRPIGAGAELPESPEPRETGTAVPPEEDL